MSNSKTVSSGTSNFNTGKNPVTGKEFFILAKRGNKLFIRESYQTRVGALKHKQQGELVVTDIKDWIERKKYQLKNNQDYISYLRRNISGLKNQLRDCRDTQKRYLEGKLSSFENKLNSSYKLKLSDYSELL